MTFFLYLIHYQHSILQRISSLLIIEVSHANDEFAFIFRMLIDVPPHTFAQNIMSFCLFFWQIKISNHIYTRISYVFFSQCFRILIIRTPISCNSVVCLFFSDRIVCFGLHSSLKVFPKNNAVFSVKSLSGNTKMNRKLNFTFFLWAYNQKQNKKNNINSQQTIWLFTLFHLRTVN